MYPYTWFYNPAVFNQQSYDRFVAEQRMREYEWEQNEAVMKACNAFDDLFTELSKIDAAHQNQLMGGCCAVLVKHGLIRQNQIL